ncbi:MAG: aminodeoxychorismate/anthranilate synthase component II [Planctomycetota bacterium]
MILVVDNYDSFTWNLVQRLGELDRSLVLDRDLVVLRNDQVSAGAAADLDSGKGPSHIIISPGPCTPEESGNSRDIIEAFAGKVPILGVCLGHQCIGDRYGMAVTTHHRVMHGKTSEVHHDGRGVFAGLPSPFTATRYHSLIVQSDSVPTEADGDGSWSVSAWCDEPEGRVVMGLRRDWAGGSAPLEGVQFHPESFLTNEGPRLLKNFIDL